jgi:hypothetical protein
MPVTTTRLLKIPPRGVLHSCSLVLGDSGVDQCA